MKFLLNPTTQRTGFYLNQTQLRLSSTMRHLLPNSPHFSRSFSTWHDPLTIYMLLGDFNCVPSVTFAEAPAIEPLVKAATNLIEANFDSQSPDWAIFKSIWAYIKYPMLAYFPFYYRHLKFLARGSQFSETFHAKALELIMDTKLVYSHAYTISEDRADAYRVIELNTKAEALLAEADRIRSHLESTAPKWQALALDIPNHWDRIFCDLKAFEFASKIHLSIAELVLLGQSKSYNEAAILAYKNLAAYMELYDLKDPRLLENLMNFSRKIYKKIDDLTESNKNSAQNDNYDSEFIEQIKKDLNELLNESFPLFYPLYGKENQNLELLGEIFNYLAYVHYDYCLHLFGKDGSLYLIRDQKMPAFVKANLKLFTAYFCSLAVNFDRTNFIALNNYGRVMAEIGNSSDTNNPVDIQDEGIQRIRESLKLNPSFPLSRLNLVDIYTDIYVKNRSDQHKQSALSEACKLRILCQSAKTDTGESHFPESNFTNEALKRIENLEKEAPELDLAFETNLDQCCKPYAIIEFEGIMREKVAQTQQTLKAPGILKQALSSTIQFVLKKLKIKDDPILNLQDLVEQERAFLAKDIDGIFAKPLQEPTTPPAAEKQDKRAITVTITESGCKLV